MIFSIIREMDSMVHPKFVDIGAYAFDAYCTLFSFNAAERISLQSSNSWDAVDIFYFDSLIAWCNRLGLGEE